MVMITNSPQAVSALSEQSGRSQSLVYFHMRKLMAVGLVYSLGHGQGYVADVEYLKLVLSAMADMFGVGGDEV
jgi:DNA-binding IclR family transcriptional regulator